MNIFKLAAAAALVFSGLAAPAVSADVQGNHRGEYRQDNMRHDRGRDDNARRGNGRHHARNHHRRHRVCRTVWRHHHRQRVCTWRHRR